MIRIEKLVYHPLAGPSKGGYDIKEVLKDLANDRYIPEETSDDVPFSVMIEAADYIGFLESKLGELIKCFKNASTNLLAGEDNEKIFG